MATEVIKSIKASGGDYTSLAAWAAATGWDTNSTEHDPFANTFGTFAVG